MKRLLLMCASALLLLGCAEDKLAQSSSDELVAVSFKADASVSGETTRAVADGDGAAAKVNHWVMEVRDSDGDVYVYKEEDGTEGEKTHTFNVSLIKGQTYNVLFWADTKGTYNVADLTNVKLLDAEQTGYAANLDSRDAFSAVVSGFSTTTATSQSVTLKRPFAQLNVIFTDLSSLWGQLISTDEYLKFKPTTFKALAKVPTSFNVQEQTAGTPAATALNITADANYLDNYTTHGAEETLFMDYFFASADSKDVVDIDFSFVSKGVTVSHKFTSVPFQRNYRTNIKGNLMTADAKWTVTVDPVWASDTAGVLVYELVADIAGANSMIASQVAAGEDEINIKFSQEPNDAGVPGTQSGELVSKAIVTTDLPENTQLNVLVESETKALYVGDYESETNATLASRGKNDAVVNITATATITSLVINAPSKTVYLNGQEISSVGTITSVEATTSQNTFIINKNQTINSLTIHQGGLEIHGTVAALAISETDHDNNPVKVRTSEGLSAEVFAVIKGDSPSAHNYIDTPYYVEKVNATNPVTYDIVPVDPVAQIGEVKYYTLADAFASATVGQTIELLRNYSVPSSIIVENSVTLNLNNDTLTCCVASGRPLLVKSDVAFTVKDGVFVDGTNDESFGAIDTRISGVAQSNVMINVSNVDFGEFDSDGNCTAAFNTNNGAIIKFRSTGVCNLTDVRAASDHYILDNTDAVSTAVSGGKFIVNHNNPCSDSNCVNPVCAFNLPYGTSSMENVTVTVTNCDACVSGNVVLTNCSMNGDKYAVVTSGMDTVKIKSGSYTGGTDAVRVQTSGGTVNINGGTFTGTANALFANVNTSQYSSAVATINVYAGQINGDMTVSSSPCYINLYGGLYSVEPSTTDAKVGSGYAQSSNEDSLSCVSYPWIVAASNDGTPIYTEGSYSGPAIKIGDVWWAPVNCGYVAKTGDSGDALGYPWGKLYQWGRKYGQGYDANDATTPNIAEYWAGNNGEEDPNTFYKAHSFSTTDSTYRYDWIKLGSTAFWNSATGDNSSDKLTTITPVKTKYDPCPEGWRVPTYAELNALLGNNTAIGLETGDHGTLTNVKGRYFNGTSNCTSATAGPKVFLPAAGTRGETDGHPETACYRGTDFSRYWSSSVTTSVKNKSYALAFNSEREAIMTGFRRLNAYSIRCVKE